MSLFYFFWGFIIIERLIELKIAGSNRKKLIQLGAIEYDKRGYRYIVVMHVLFLTFLVIENYFQGYINQFSVHLFSLFLILQVIRYWCIFTLGIYWNTVILIVPGSKIIKKGPYRYLKHPNYLVVTLEFLIIPLIFSLYFTCIIFSIVNILVLTRRVQIENSVLGYS